MMINVQGRLTGDPLESGRTQVVFEIYEGGTETGGGTARLSSTKTVITEGAPTADQILVDPTTRIFNVILGPTGMPEFLAETYYLQITVGGQTLMPRQRLVSVPFAITAKHITGEGASVFIWTSSAPWYGPIFSRNETAAGGFGVVGFGRSAGVVGEGIGGDAAGVEGYTSSEAKAGVRGYNSRTVSGDNPGVLGESYRGIGVYGKSGAENKAAVFGDNTSSGSGVRGDSAFGIGVAGVSKSTTFTTPNLLGVPIGGVAGAGDGFAGVSGGSVKNYGVYGATNSSIYAGVGGVGPGVGVYGSGGTAGGSFESTSGYAGYFGGRVKITGTLEVGSTSYPVSLTNKLTGTGSYGLSFVYGGDEKTSIDRFGGIRTGYGSSTPSYGIQAKGARAGGSFESTANDGIGVYGVNTRNIAVYGKLTSPVASPFAAVKGEAGKTVGSLASLQYIDGFQSVTAVCGSTESGRGVAGISSDPHFGGVFAENIGGGPALEVGSGRIKIAASEGTGTPTAKKNTPVGGKVTIPDGSNDVFVHNSYVTDSSIILLTIQSGAAAPIQISSKSQGSGFQIHVNRLNYQDITHEFHYYTGDIEVGYLIIN